MSRSRIMLAVALCSLALGSSAQADPTPIPTVVGTVTPLSNGQYRYDYTVTNTDPFADHVHIKDLNTGQWIVNPTTQQPVTGANYELGSRLTQFQLWVDNRTITSSSAPPGFPNDFKSYPWWDAHWGGNGYSSLLPGVGQSAHFSITATTPPTTLHWHVQYDYWGGNDGFRGARWIFDENASLNADATQQVDPIQEGTVVGPAGIPPVPSPEPTSGVLMGLGSLAMAAGSLFRRLRALRGA